MRKQSIMNLWQQCFHDSEEFIQFYFEQKYRDEYSMLYTENGEALSAYLMLPYPLIWDGKTFMTSYISGACTAPQARNRGLMTYLLKKGFQQMYDNNVALSTLIPAETWLYEYYKQLGYATVFYKSTNLWQPIPITSSTYKIEIVTETFESITQESYTYFSKKMQDKPCYIAHTFEDYNTILGDLYLSGGKLILARQSLAPYSICGIALATCEETEITVKELLYDTLEIYNQLLTVATDYWKAPRAVCRTSCHFPTAQPYGMARIIHLNTLLQHYAATHPELEETLSVADNILPYNQGTFHISHGECQKTSDTLSNTATNITALPKKLFAFLDEQPYMNLMID